MRKHKMALGLLVASVLLACPVGAYAEDAGEGIDISDCSINPVSERFETSSALDGCGQVSVKRELSSGSSAWILYPTFDDADRALATVREKASKVLNLLRNEFGLAEFSSENWEAYRTAMYDMYGKSDCPDWYVEWDEGISALESFFDIYENDRDNEEIENAIALAQLNPKAINSDDSTIVEEIEGLLPDQDVLSGKDVDHTDSAKASSRAKKDFNASKGVAYAKKYADGKNFPKYAYCSQPFGGDCTNFVSQILEAGGVKQVKSDSEKKGWWHKSHNGAHTHSDSWIKAKTFAKYMGISYKTKSHKAFSKKVKKGDFIAFDKESDGNAEHMAFVTATSSKTYKGANDYQVAQHTKDYLAWMSSATNGWENKEDGKLSYYIVRR